MEADNGDMYKCFMCPVTISIHAEWNAHIISHFQQTHCFSCSSDLICIGDIWFKPHANGVCDTIKTEKDIETTFADPLQTIDPHETEQSEGSELEAELLYEHEDIGDETMQSFVSTDEIKCEAESMEPLDQATENGEAAESTSSDKQQRQPTGKKTGKTRPTVSRFASAECVECDRKFASAQSAKSHYYSCHHYATVPYKPRRIAPKPYDTPTCGVCGHMFANKASCKSHYYKQHYTRNVTEWLECDRCAKPFSCLATLNRHKIKHTDENVDNAPTFQCNVCDDRFLYIMQLVKHMKSHAGIDRYKCVMCHRAFGAHDAYFTHVHRFHLYATATYDIRKFFQCPVCDKRFVSALTMTIHLRKHDTLADFECCIYDCLQKFDSYAALYRHIIEHQKQMTAQKKSAKPAKPPDPPAERLTCDICSKTYYDKSSIRKHMKAKHIPRNEISVPRQYRCEICSTSYPNQNRLTSHIFATHIKEDRKVVHRHRCCSCDESFRYITALTDHLKTHTHLTEYTCMLHGCGKQMADLDALRRHLRYHTMQGTKGAKGDPATLAGSRRKPLACKVCKRLIVAGKQHMCNPIRSMERVVCDHCSVEFRNRIVLRYHMNRVNGVKPYKCKICSMGFASPAEVCRHQFIH